MRTQATVGIARDPGGWSERFVHFADKLGVPYEHFDIDRSDWIDEAKSHACVVWRPNLDHPLLEQGREKIWFMESHLKLRVFPNWTTFSLYDNKRAQAYFLRYHNIPAPDTFVSYSQPDSKAFLDRTTFPLVSKTSGGAASSGVHLIKTRSDGMKEQDKAFRRSFLTRALRRLGYEGLRSLSRPDGYVLWQEFLPGNDFDCRLTVIGQRYVLILFRRNRPGDFRASGSGLKMFEGPIGEREAKYFVDLCRKHNFDSMAFDLLLKDGSFRVSEMSYTFPLAFLDDVPGHYEFDEDGHCHYHEGPIQPQELQMRWVKRWLDSTSA